MASNLLNKAFLPTQTRALLDRIVRSEAFSRLTLVGGSALAMRIGHRLSEDLDFVWEGEKLSDRHIDRIFAGLGSDRKVESLISPAELQRFRKEEGINLLDYRRKYVVDGVKLEFFVHHKPQIGRLIRDADKDLLEGSLKVLGLDGLFVTKSVVIGERRRSRDLFDLMVLIRDHGYSIDRLVDAVRKHDPIADVANNLATLRGTVDLDDEDEGLATVEVQVTVDEIYSFFRERIADYEARQVAAQVKAWRAEESIDKQADS